MAKKPHNQPQSPDSGERARKVGKGYRPEGEGFYGPDGPTGGTRPDQTPQSEPKKEGGEAP